MIVSVYRPGSLVCSQGIEAVDIFPPILRSSVLAIMTADTFSSLICSSVLKAGGACPVEPVLLPKETLTG